MIVAPKVRGFICTTAHPEGLAALVRADIAAADRQGVRGPRKRALVVGSSMGYGLASRIALLCGYDADTIGVHFDRPPAPEQGKTASAGYYNTAAFERQARVRGRVAVSLNEDAFSAAAKDHAIAKIRELLGQIDVLVYSMAAPVRTHPDTGALHRSVIKGIGGPGRTKSLDPGAGTVSFVDIPVASEQEIADTLAVMGGDDLRRWVSALLSADVLAPGCRAVAYTYIGPALTHAIYKDGTIGRAKDDVQAAVAACDALLAPILGRCYLSVNKALVTQSSSAIPALPLYISLLLRAMKERGTHETTLDQAVRLFAPDFFSAIPQDPAAPLHTDGEGRIRLDDREMAPDLQADIACRWQSVDTDNLASLADLAGYRSDFLRLFGFDVPGIDYQADVDIG